MDEATFAIGSPPNQRTWLKSKKKNFSKNINLPVQWPFTIFKDNLNLKVDFDIYLAPCKKAKGSEIYFSCNRSLKLAHFCRFRGRDELLRKSLLVTIFDHTGVNFKKLLLKGFISQKPNCCGYLPHLLCSKFEKKLELCYMPKYDLPRGGHYDPSPPLAASMAFYHLGLQGLNYMVFHNIF